MWRFEHHKLMGLVESGRETAESDTNYSILDTDLTLIVGNAEEALKKPSISSRVTLYDSTKPVGYYQVERSLRALVLETLLVALGGLVLALAIAFPLRSLPLRALRNAQQRLSRLAHFDLLTGLPNRALLADRLDQAILNARLTERSVTVVLVDLDNFKTINDGLGHQAGDEFLKATAVRLQEAVRSTDTVVRLGGDEFVLVLPDREQSTELITLTLHRISACIAEPLKCGAHTVRVTCSMGVATYPNDGVEAAVLLKNADLAMYRAKEFGRNNFRFFTHEMNRVVKERAALHQALVHALSNDEFVLAYQPQLDLGTGRMVGVEALIRWNHPDLGMIPPMKFIPLAEETGLIVPIGAWVLRSACLQGKAWQDAGMPPVRVSVNVSARQFKEGDWVATVKAALLESRLEAQYLELEITESLIMENVEHAIATMSDIQDLGVSLAIDDFGTGYSSLSSLKHFPVARLKIDQSFIQCLPGDDEDRSIAMAVIALGHRLNLKVIAEGVETEAQQAFLRDNECDETQGFFFSRPVPAEQVGRMLLESSFSRSADHAGQPA
jgi:diguanylate cyclase (GGDEF)-like protein